MWPTTCSVEVARKIDTGSKDSFGNPVFETQKDVVEGCLATQTDTSTETGDAQGLVTETWTIFFPQGYDKSLKGALLTVAGRTLAVSGDPVVADVPNPWPYWVKAVRHG